MTTMTETAFRLESGPSPATDPQIVRAQRQREIVLGYRLLGSWGWGDDGAGHISGRDPERVDHFWLLRYGVAFKHARVEDLVLVAPDGSIADEGANIGAQINWAAYCIHAPIHDARPDVMCAIHTHTPYGTPFAANAAPLKMLSQESCAFFGRQGVFLGEELDVLDPAIGVRLASALGAGRLLVLSNHGLLTVGDTVAEAVGFFVMAERSAEVNVKVPNGRVISEAGAAKVHESVGRPSSGWHTFEWCVRSRLV